ncbi:hypothetical protein SAMN02745751_03575 [Dethiosulfatibacter aminovorans DSM 17477]|uniref:Transcriptional regulator, AbiEi antitoxin, Type IV TA system n=1 Tax=Dethiosulfatibacter aminovorans DSM 17477 TaxID=1121476 RepID=A0A1M6MSI4_9FIRM|nr:DUF6088 family protein [Dethiosulfatibacter aminovorans]SHJ86468.1 hypothetical protein SAMN02745751_03575 [Dethiosulfatibacter aminovorans DSM 17477]
MSYSSEVVNYINRLNRMSVIDMAYLHSTRFENIPDLAYQKIFSRLEKNGELDRIVKGIYYKPEKGMFGNLRMSNKTISEYFIGSNNQYGLYIGYRMFNRLGLTTQISKSIIIYSRRIQQQSKKIGNVTVKKIDIKLSEKRIKLIELLEVLQNYRFIEDLDEKNMYHYLSRIGEFYSYKDMENILGVIKYKKRTIASLRNVLDYLGIENDLARHLNSSSKYGELNMEELYETVK